MVSPQFTLRAVLTGMILGATLSICNVYLGLKIGWGTNMSITGILIAFGFWSAVRGVSGGRAGRFNILENNINQTACSAAAAVSSAGLVAPIPALTMLTGRTLDWATLALWVFVVCLVGIMVGSALRRQMIIVDKLRFPNGLACAVTLREIYGHGREAMAQVRMLGLGAIAAAAFKLSEVLKFTSHAGMPFSLQGWPAKLFGFQLDSSVLMIGVGGIMGFRAAASMLLGAIIAWGIIAPRIVADGMAKLTASAPLAALPEGLRFAPEDPAQFQPGRKALEFKGVMTGAEMERLAALSAEPAWRDAVSVLHAASQLDATARQAAVAQLPPETKVAFAQPNYPDVVAWLLWPGVALMVVSSLVSFSFSWRSIARAFTGSKAGREGGVVEPVTDELPRRTLMLSCAVALTAATILQVWLFEISVWTAILGVLMSFALAVVAVRVAGETSITPVGAMGKVTQLVFGVIDRGNPASNLMAANVTGGAASQCADLMNDFKCGLHIGASPRKQWMAQMFGALAGSLVGCAFYLLLIPDPARQLLTDQWPAPAVATWKAVAEVFSVGFSALPQGVLVAIVIAGALGFILPIAEKLLAKHVAAWLPSAAAVGLAFTIPARNSISIFIGGVLALVLSKIFPKWSKRFLVTICAGIVVGDSLVGAGDAIWMVVGDAVSAAVESVWGSLRSMLGL